MHSLANTESLKAINVKIRPIGVRMTTGIYAITDSRCLHTRQEWDMVRRLTAVKSRSAGISSRSIGKRRMSITAALKTKDFVHGAWLKKAMVASRQVKPRNGDKVTHCPQA